MRAQCAAMGRAKFVHVEKQVSERARPKKMDQSHAVSISGRVLCLDSPQAPLKKTETLWLAGLEKLVTQLARMQATNRSIKPASQPTNHARGRKENHTQTDAPIDKARKKERPPIK